MIALGTERLTRTASDRQLPISIMPRSSGGVSCGSRQHHEHQQRAGPYQRQHQDQIDQPARTAELERDDCERRDKRPEQRQHDVLPRHGRGLRDFSLLILQATVRLETPSSCPISARLRPSVATPATLRCGRQTTWREDEASAREIPTRGSWQKPLSPTRRADAQSRSCSGFGAIKNATSRRGCEATH